MMETTENLKRDGTAVPSTNQLALDLIARTMFLNAKRQELEFDLDAETNGLAQNETWKVTIERVKPRQNARSSIEG